MAAYIPAEVSRNSWVDVEVKVKRSMLSYLDDLDQELTSQPGFKKPPSRTVTKKVTTSTTDSECGYIHHGNKRGVGYFPNRHKASSQYAEPDYPYIHRELARSGVTLTLLWEEYCAKCQEAGQRPYMSTQFGERYRRWARIDILPPLVPALQGLRTLIGCG